MSKRKHKRTDKPVERKAKATPALTFADNTPPAVASAIAVLDKKLINLLDHEGDAERAFNMFVETALTIGHFTETSAGAVICSILPTLMNYAARHIGDRNAFDHFIFMTLQGIYEINFPDTADNPPPVSEINRQGLH